MELDLFSQLSNSLGIAIVNRNIDLAKSVITELSELEESKLSKITSRVRENITTEEWSWFQSLLSDGNESKAIAPLLPEDKELKQELETRIIENTKRFFIDTGRDLHTLKQRKLYREQYNSWQSYCQLELGINPTTANRAIKAYQDCESIRIYFDDDFALPKTDYVLRILGEIKDVELRAKVWGKAVEECEESPTTSDIKRVYAEIVSPEIKPPKPNNLEFNVGNFVSIKNEKAKWGKVIDITSGLRYRIRSGDIVSTYQTYQVIPLEIPFFIAEAVEKLYQTHSPKLTPTNSLFSDSHPHTKSLATTFYGFDKFEDWQITLLGSLISQCQ